MLNEIVQCYEHSKFISSKIRIPIIFIIHSILLSTYIAYIEWLVYLVRPSDPIRRFFLKIDGLKMKCIDCNSIVSGKI